MNKTCKVCKKPFKAYTTIQNKCISCAIAAVEREKPAKAKQQRKADKLKKDALRPYSYWVKKAQAAFNKFIRLRDSEQPCISCQRHHTGQYHAGHFQSTGARSELRFHPANNNKQCSCCNNHLSGNLVLYRKNLLEKVGAGMVDYLENFNNSQRWTVPELLEIEAHYKAEFKRLKEQI